jgi:hypothetical protein
LSAAELGIPGVGFYLGWWKRLGLRWTLPLLFVIGLPAGAYSTMAHAAGSVVPGWINNFGVAFEAGSWDFSIWGLTATASDVALRADSRAEPVFTAREVEFDGSLRTLLASLFSERAFYNTIVVRGGELHLEQSLTGDWNWSDFLRRVPAERRANALNGLYQANALYVEDAKVVYTEHVPSQSGGGVIQTAQATIFVDDVNGWITDLVRPASADDRPTHFDFKARSADGRIEIRGDAGMFASAETSAAGTATAGSPAAPVTVRTTSGIESGAVASVFSGPTVSVRVFLDNIGMGAYGRMVSTTLLQPVRGTLRGSIEVTRTQEGIVCISNLAVDDVQFAPNARLIPVRAQYDTLQRDLVAYRQSGAYDACGTPDSQRRIDRPSARTLTALLASFNAQTTEDAPMSVQAVAAYDQEQITGTVANAVLADTTGRLAAIMGREVGQLLGPQSGAAIEAALGGKSNRDGSVDGQPNSNNPLASGIRSVGSGFKRLFGGGR